MDAVHVAESGVQIPVAVGATRCIHVAAASCSDVLGAAVFAGSVDVGSLVAPDAGTHSAVGSPDWWCGPVGPGAHAVAADGVDAGRLRRLASALAVNTPGCDQ